jgi:beta-glucoside operon transcriptional antiterminator
LLLIFRQNQILQKSLYFCGVWSFLFKEGILLRVLKAINNNVVSCVDRSGRELVVMGRGLGFRAKPGDILQPSAAEKVFRMDSAEKTDQFKELITRLPPRLLELCSQIIDHAQEALGHRLNESIYLTLTDHIHFALERSRQKVDLLNPLLTEVKVFYPVEFAVGQYALERIRTEMGVTLVNDEAASIALHLVNAEFDGSMSTTMRAVQVLPDLMNVLEQWPDLQLNKKHLFYDELMVHIKFLAIQTVSGVEQEWSADMLTQTVQTYIPNEYRCAGEMIRCLNEKSGKQIPAAEQAYLAVCIHRACIS